MYLYLCVYLSRVNVVADLDSKQRFCALLCVKRATHFLIEVKTMKLLIAGSRSITDFDISPYIPADTDVIISGGAGGVDTLAEKYADKMKLSKYIIRPNYARYKKGAPLKRNDEMVDMCDMVLVFWDGISTGTKHTIDYASKIGKKIEIVEI